MPWSSSEAESVSVPEVRSCTERNHRTRTRTAFVTQECAPITIVVGPTAKPGSIALTPVASRDHCRAWLCMRAICVELARNAWDFHDAAVGVQSLLGERDEYPLRATVLIACLIRQSLELALRAYVLSVDTCRAHVSSGERNQDLCSLFGEANELGLRRPLGPDDYDVRALGALEQLCSLSLLQHHSAHCEAVRLFAQMQELCARVLEALQSGFTIDADSCDASIY